MHMSQVDSPLAQAVVLVEVETGEGTVVAEAWDAESTDATSVAEAEAEALRVAEAEALRAAEVISIDTFTNAEATKAEATVLLGVPVDWC